MFETIDNNNTEISREIIYCGIGNHESVLHFGACDKGLHFIKVLDEFGLDVQYTAVDVDDEVNTLFSDYEPMERTHPWISVQEPMQEFIDNNDGERYMWTLVTGIFDKPLYSERQYQFIDTVIDSCFAFSDNVIFTIKEQATPVFKYSMVYLFQHFNMQYRKVTVKKVEDGKYIFHVSI